MTSTTPQSPADLEARGRKFWRRTVDAYELSDGELELLAEVCRLLDECERLRRAIATDGTIVHGSAGQPRVNPAVGELRQHRLAVGRLLGQLDLPDESGASLPTPAQATARKAAQARWRAHNERRAAHG